MATLARDGGYNAHQARLRTDALITVTSRSAVDHLELAVARGDLGQPVGARVLRLIATAVIRLAADSAAAPRIDAADILGGLLEEFRASRLEPASSACSYR